MKKNAKLIKNNNSVRVAVRIRPQSGKEKEEPIYLSVIPGEPQLTIGRDKSFAYDFVFDQLTPQKTVYDKCVRELVDGAFEGYNTSVFAYGQTGSGKTFTMGTSLEGDPAKRGIIPNAAQQIFDEIEGRREQARRSGKVIPSLEVSAQFIELYNEELIDLLSPDRDSSSIKIMENPTSHEILLMGASSRSVNSQEDILSALAIGAQNRTTAATNMNKQSSRSHAIFTLNIKQTRVVPVDDDSDEKENNTADEGGDDEEESSEKMGTGGTELETLHAKFHFIDLAGSERLSRTGATGDRVKESISINSGLLALGNVISALGGAKGRIGTVHVPYRDSKLTRLLQDSLGGNSRTLMITCVNPNQIDAIETLGSLNYANRIKNKVVIPDPIIQLPSLGAPDYDEALIRAQEQLTKQLARFHEFEKTEQQNVKLYDARLRRSLFVADMDRERVLSLEDELGKVKTELTVQGREHRQLQRKYVALVTRVREYETELENGREQMERAKRYIVDQENRTEKDARRTLLKLAEMFESPIPTTSNVARLRKQFDDDDNDADDN